MIEKEAFIAALLPICDTVCEYDRTRGKLRVRKTSLASGLEDKWYTVEELRDIFRDNGGVLAEKSVWMRYLSSENLRSFFYEKERNESFRLRFRQGGVGCRQYDIRIDRINDKVLVISGRDTQEQEIDALTGALSRNHYQREMSNEVYRGGVALIDMDDLKLYNDINGHQVGDNALRVLADTIYEVVGCSGSLVRYGGDEFLLLLPGVEQAAFATVLGDIQRRLRTVSIPGCEGGQHITISVGCVMAQQETIAQAVQRADRLMYRAKRRKDAVVTEDTPVEEGEEIKPHILVVDDAAINRAILREMLAEDVLTYGNTAMQESPVAAEAMFKLDCIHRALMEIPEIYREGIIENIQTRRTGYPCSAHENTWKKWKQRFIYMLAENLRLIP